jgi:Type IV secretion system pilin
MLKSLDQLVNKATDIVSIGIANLLMAIAFLVFLLAIINYIWKRREGDTNGMKQAGNMLLGSVFGLFIMVAVWGLVNFISSNLLGADGNKKTIERPQTLFKSNIVPSAGNSNLPESRTGNAPAF